jgi:hypothetical protein
MATNACTRGRSGRYVAAKPILSSSIPHQEKPVSGSSSLWPKAPTLAEHRRTASAPVRWREGNRPGPCSHGPKAQARSGGRTLTRPSMEWPGRNLRGMVTTMALPGRGRAEAIARLLAPVEDRVREREGGEPPTRAWRSAAKVPTNSRKFLETRGLFFRSASPPGCLDSTPHNGASAFVQCGPHPCCPSRRRSPPFSAAEAEWGC